MHVMGEVKVHSYLLQRLGVAVQRGNAAVVMGTLNRAIEHNFCFFCLFVCLLFTLSYYNVIVF